VLRRLTIANFRCLEHVEVELDTRCTVFVGANGAGKTSILESAHVLSCGRSFRTHRLNQLIRVGCPELLVVGELDQGSRSVVTGIRVSRDSVEAHAGGQKVHGMADLASNLPLYVIDPNVHRVLEDGPENRRRLIDRGLFHVEPSFIVAWRQYQRALKQRNSILKAQGTDLEVRAWEPDLVQAGSQIAEGRARYIQELRPLLQHAASVFFGDAVEIEVDRGWTRENFADDLNHCRERDRRVGSTTTGPHRADLRICFRGQVAKQYVSRGQQKLLSASIILAQVAQFAASQNRGACLLLDDPAAELDVDNFEKLLRQIEQTNAQLLVTGLDATVLARRFSTSMFHVEQGRASRLL
jgi:DNA replication and repair protein RecF